MNFGVPKEIPPFKETEEYRVGLTPQGAQELVLCGAKVFVESKAGEGAGFLDAEYENAGATVVFSKEEAYRRADVVLKVRKPQQDEYSMIREGQTIMGFIHLVTVRKEFLNLVADKKITLIGYEIMQKSDGRLPIVVPFSELAGRLSVQIAGRLLESPHGGRGILLSGVPGIPAAEVVILGGGTLGCNAAKTFAGIGANVYVLDVERDKLENLACQSVNLKITTMFATRHNIEKLVQFADVVIGAVLVRGRRAPVLVTQDMVKTMRKGSVIIDFSIDQGGCFETSKISPSGKFIYTIEDVIHFCMPNATTLIARTASHALTSSIFPYLKMMTESGFEFTLRENHVVASGVYAENGEIKKEFLP